MEREGKNFASIGYGHLTPDGMSSPANTFPTNEVSKSSIGDARILATEIVALETAARATQIEDHVNDMDYKDKVDLVYVE